MRIYKTHVNIHSQLKIYIPTDRLMRRDKVVRAVTKNLCILVWRAAHYTGGGIYLWG